MTENQNLPDNTTPETEEYRYTTCTMKAFCALDIPPREFLLYPVLAEKGLAMVYAERGVGKTFVALSMAMAIASGVDFMRFSSKKTCKVLYIDGEMSAWEMQERMKHLKSGFASMGVSINMDDIEIFSSDLQDWPIRNLSTPDGQEVADNIVASNNIGCVIIDNISSLCSASKENDADGWEPMQRWLIDLRRRKVSVLLVHHAGKGGNQRGTSKREDVLDTVISLKKRDGYHQKDGAKFNVVFEKSRAVHGNDVEAFQAMLCPNQYGDGLIWTVSPIQSDNEKKVQAAGNKSVRKIAKETGMSKSTAQRMKKKLAKAEKIEEGAEF